MKKIFTLIAVAAMAISANAQTATDAYLDIANYASLDNIDLKNCTNLYSYDATGKVLVLSAYAAYQSSTQGWNNPEKKSLGWVSYTSSGSSNVSGGWEATGVFKGSAYYGLQSGGSASDRAAAINSSREYAFKVTGCSAVSILGKSGKKTDRKVIFTVKEGATVVGSREDDTNNIVTLTISELDASKTYDVTVTGNTSDNGHFYEIAFTQGGTTGLKILSAEEVQNGAIYNLAGQKVNEDYKGIVIKNGKKFIQK